MEITVPTSSGHWVIKAPKLYNTLGTVPDMLQLLDKHYLVKRVRIIMVAVVIVNHKNHAHGEERQMEKAIPVRIDGETKQ